MKRWTFGAIALLGVTASLTFAQVATGNIYGAVIDESGAMLPGVSINLSGATTGARATTSGKEGDFRFLNLDPGTYKLTVTLTGFSTVNRQVIVTTGGSVNVSFGLKVASVEETVTVTAQSPIVDTKKLGTGTTLSKEELSQIPNSRDPWAVLRTIPGVVVDRVNIGGNESGQQSMVLGKGADTKDVMWNIDGVVITDMAAIGASPTYYDYDAFDEINVSTGGNDLKVATGGIGLNFVTKRGTNRLKGGVHGYFTNHDLQTSNLAGTGLENDPRLKLPDGSFSDKADHIDQIADYGADLGGPLVKDKLWFWGSYGKQDIRNVRTNQTKDKTILKDYTAKINWQAGASDMVSLFWFQGAKEKLGRSPGVAGNEPDSFLWNQGGKYPGRLHGLFKAELNHTFGPSLFVNLKYAYYGTGFGFDPRGGTENEGGVNTATNTAVGSYLTFTSLRPQRSVNLDGNYFASSLGGSHELKFGFAYRRTPVESMTSFSGNEIYAVKNDATSGYALVTRDRVASYRTQYWSGYLGDTFSKNRLTLSAGVRFDQQGGENLPTTAKANPVFPELLPDLDYPGGGQGVDWTNVSPRAGITFALDQSRKTVARASYARYAGQLSAADPIFDNPLGSVSYLAYNWLDLNGDGLAQKGELLVGQGVQYYGFVDPANPAVATSPNRIRPDYSANIDNEVIVGLDHELLPNLALSAAYTYRKSTNTGGWTPRLGMSSADYTANAPQSRNGYTGYTFSPNASLVAAYAGGRILANRPDYARQYDGFELTLTKRLSNRWMARAAFSWMSWIESYEGPAAVQNPTASDTNFNTNGVGGFAGPQVDGGLVAPRSGGSGKGDIFVAPKWQVVANALYQLPAGFEISGSLFGRQGYPRPIVMRLSAGGDGTLRALATPDIDTVRYENLWNLDLRLSKSFKLAGTSTLQISADFFNVFNSNTVLNQTRQANSSAFNRIDELLSPRVLRVGARLQF